MYRLIIYNQRFGKFDLVRIVPFPNANPPLYSRPDRLQFGTAMVATGKRVPSCPPDSLSAEVLELYCVAAAGTERDLRHFEAGSGSPPPFSSSRRYCTTRSRMRPPFHGSRGYHSRRHKNSFGFLLLNLFFRDAHTHTFADQRLSACRLLSLRLHAFRGRRVCGVETGLLRVETPGSAAKAPVRGRGEGAGRRYTLAEQDWYGGVSRRWRNTDYHMCRGSPMLPGFMYSVLRIPQFRHPI